MSLWILIACATAIAVLAVLWPLSRSRRTGDTGGTEVAIYQDQLAEITRDEAAGLLPAGEAEAARLEVSRRLLAATQTGEAGQEVASTGRRRLAAVVALVVIPALSLPLYLRLGSPQTPDQPLAARTSAPAKDGNIANLISQVEAHLQRNPDDGKGWELLAPVYMRAGRYEEAARARANALRLLGETASRQADLGEALAAQADGIITAESRAAFEKAAKLDPEDPKPAFFLGIAAEQDGKPAEAVRLWSELIARSPADAPWVPVVRQAIARLDPAAVATPAPQAAPGPSQQDMAAAAQMPKEQQDEMIRSMVARLAEKLKTDGSDVEGWLRLVRAYVVMGDAASAKGAAADARRALKDDAAKLERINELARSLGLGEG